MSNIKSNEKIIASDLNDLKTKIITMYGKRPYLTSDQIDTAGTALDNTSFSAGDHTKIKEIGDIINALLVINDIPNLKKVDLLNDNSYVNLNEKIFSDGTSTELNSWLSNSKMNATGMS